MKQTRSKPSRGEVEALLANAIIQFEKDQLGRGTYGDTSIHYRRYDPSSPAWGVNAS